MEGVEKREGEEEGRERKRGEEEKGKGEEERGGGEKGEGEGRGREKGEGRRGKGEGEEKCRKEQAAGREMGCSSRSFAQAEVQLVVHWEVPHLAVAYPQSWAPQPQLLEGIKEEWGASDRVKSINYRKLLFFRLVNFRQKNIRVK